MTTWGVSTAWKALRAQWRGLILLGSLEEAPLRLGLRGQGGFVPTKGHRQGGQAGVGGSFRETMTSFSGDPSLGPSGELGSVGSICPACREMREMG